jgi:hypothetical protein
MSIMRNETDARLTLYTATAVGTTATQLTPINHEGLQQAALYIANMCTQNIHYDIKGCYNEDVTSTAYWYSIATGVATASTVNFIGAHDISGLADAHQSLTVEYYASAATTGTFVIQLQIW